MPEWEELWRLAKEAFWSPATESWKQALIGPYLLQQRQSVSLHIWCHQGPHNPSSCATFMLNPHWGRVAMGKKMSSFYAWRVASVMSHSLWCCELGAARLLCQGAFCRQGYWSILANIGFHTLLEHYISCCPSCQLPWVPSAARTPATQAASPPPDLSLTGANPSPPGQPQEQTPVDDPHTEVEIKPQLKLRGNVEERRPKTFPPAV